MITGAHAIIFNHDADAVRAFFRDAEIALYQPRHPTATHLGKA